MGRAVLWITPPLDSSQNLALEDIISRADQQGITIFIWLVAASEAEENPAAPPSPELRRTP